MKLNQSSEPVMRVYELAKELGWPAKQLVVELCSRGEYVKSPMSAVPAPVVRAIRREFATNSNAITSDARLNPEGYGKSAGATADEQPNDSFAAALADARSYFGPNGDRATVRPMATANLAGAARRRGSPKSARSPR